MKKPIVMDLFAGVGGMSLGFEQAGFDVKYAVEIDPVHAYYHRENFPNTRMIVKPIQEVSGKELAGAVDVLVGGSPCQGFSVGGKRNENDSRNSLTDEFVRMVLEVRPKYFVFENVKGITSGYGHKYLKKMIDTLWTLGNYEVLPYQVLNAKNYNVPQNRERLILIGYFNGMPAPTYPAPHSYIPTVWNAISDLPEPTNYPELWERDYTICTYGEPSDYAKPLVWDRNKITASKLTRHSFEVMARFQATEFGKREPRSHFFKLDPAGLCPTLRAGTGKEQGNHTAARPIHPYTPRVITPREAARLHSYPDSFRFPPSPMWAMRQIGNSVCPNFAAAIASEIFFAFSP